MRKEEMIAKGMTRDDVYDYMNKIVDELYDNYSYEREEEVWETSGEWNEICEERDEYEIAMYEICMGDDEFIDSTGFMIEDEKFYHINMKGSDLWELAEIEKENKEADERWAKILEETK